VVELGRAATCIPGERRAGRAGVRIPSLRLEPGARCSSLSLQGRNALLPEAGFPNPTVEVKPFHQPTSTRLRVRPAAGNSRTIDSAVEAATYTLEFDSPFPANDVVVGEVSWVSESQVLYKVTNRIATFQRVA
jgi:hypothetical protein